MCKAFGAVKQRVAWKNMTHSAADLTDPLVVHLKVHGEGRSWTGSTCFLQHVAQTCTNNS